MAATGLATPGPVQTALPPPEAAEAVGAAQLVGCARDGEPVGGALRRLLDVRGVDGDAKLVTVVVSLPMK